MKITGTPAADFVVKLQSQDVSHTAAKPQKHNTDEAQYLLRTVCKSKSSRDMRDSADTVTLHLLFSSVGIIMTD